jgi:uncharacterized damage-inducible protein DinB
VTTLARSRGPARRPGRRAAEREALLGYLSAQRTAVLAVVDGLDEASLRRSVVPSGWTCLGLLEHLGHAERFWAQEVLSAEMSVLPWTDPDAEWDPGAELVSDHELGEVVAFYHDQCARTDAIVADLSLDGRPAGLRRRDLPARATDVRDVVLHLIEETARHAGHLDIARELLDGRTGLGPR